MSQIDLSQLRAGVVIVYKLLPEHRPKNPERVWHGKILKTVFGAAYSLNVMWVESLEEGYEGLTEYVYPEQVVRTGRE